MKNIAIILVVNFFLVSCIDMIKSSEEEYYESVYLQGGGWFEFYQNSATESLELNDDFTFQVWFSGQEEYNDDAPCIASLKGNESNISIYRNPTINNMIMIYNNDELIKEIELDIINFDEYQNFYLLSIIKIQNQIIIYINDTSIKETATVENGVWDWLDLNNDNLYDDGEFEPFIDEENGMWDEGEEFTDVNENGMWDEGEEFIDEENGIWDEGEEFEDNGIPLVIINDETIKPIVGAIMNDDDNPDNLWYGYIDEIRLWDIALRDSIINFHNQYPTKVSKEYNSDYLPSLNGLWTFRINISENNISNIFQDINDNLNYTIIYTLESMSNELSELGR